MRCLPVFALLLMIGGDAAAQWGPRGCSPVGPSLNTVSRVWQVPANDPGRVYLYVNGRLAGGYCSRSGLYLPWDGSSWGRDWQSPPDDVPASFVARVKAGCGCSGDCRCGDCSCRANGPCSPGCLCGDCGCSDGCRCGADCQCNVQGPCSDNCRCLAQDFQEGDDPITYNGGVDTKRLQSAELFSLSGRPASRDEIIQALSQANLADDRAKPRLTLIGSKEDCDRALADLPADLKGKWLVQSYRGDNWAVAQAGFVTGGNPAIYLQHPPDPKTGLGKVAWRQVGYKAGDWEAVRKADPSYKPDKDPGPNNQPPFVLPNLLPLLASLPSWFWLVLGIGGTYFFLNRRKQ